MKNKVTYISGGCKSGKSRFALQLTRDYEKKVFMATAEAMDREMRERIRQHQEERGPGFLTIEEPLEVGRTLFELLPGTEVVIIDCLAVWVANLMHYRLTDKEECIQLQDLLQALESPLTDIVLVSNELGMGLVPREVHARRYRDLMGQVNQQVASLSHETYFVVSGIPMRLK